MSMQADTFLNKDIELFVSIDGSLELDEAFGWRAYQDYLHDIMLRRSGFEYKELGISKRREASRSRIITFNDGLPSLVDTYDIQNGNVPKGSIAVLKLSGVMRSNDSLSTPGINSLISDLRDAYQSQKIDGVIMEVDSGGGESIAGTKLASAIGERNKPVVILGHFVGSAAYRAAAAADEVIASGSGAEFGSIGTMVTIDSALLKNYRDRFIDFYGTDAPKKNEGFRNAQVGNYAAIQQRVDELTLNFHNEIKAARKLTGDVQDTLSGAMFTAANAKDRGLVDLIGNMNDAVKRVMTLKKKY